MIILTQLTVHASTLLACAYRLRESEIEHSAALSGAVTALKHDEETRLSRKVESMREQEKVQYSCRVDRLKQEWETEKKAAVAEVEAKYIVIKTELKNLQQSYDAQVYDNKLIRENIVSNCYSHNNQSD